MTQIRILLVAFSILTVAANAATVDQETTVEFKGPWCFISVTNNKDHCGGGSMVNCIVAISPNHDHKLLVFAGSKPTFVPISLQSGVYTLTLTDFKNSDLTYQQQHLVPTGADTVTYQNLIKSSLPGEDPKDRYVVILPYAPMSSFERPSEDEFTENASITDFFRPPDQEFGEQEEGYAKGVKIHYKVSDLEATLTGRADGQAQDVTYSQTAPLKFLVDPVDKPNYFCDFHARQAFKDMNELLKTQPFLYVDFPYYTGFCRQMDPQRYAGASDSSFSLLFVDSKSINGPAVLELITTSEKLNQKLALSYRGATEKEIAALLQQTREYLKNDPKGHKEEGEKLAKKLNNVRKILGQVADSRDKQTLVKRLSVLLDMIKTATDSGANCKAPMMSLTLQ